jgi:hypothetical protein
MYNWKCHKETPYIAILKPTKMSFFSFTKLENGRVEQVLSGWGVPMEEGRMCRNVVEE